MPYCMCKENFDYCKCDQHICPKHKRKVTARPVPDYNLSTTGSAFSFTSPTFTTDSGSVDITGFNQ